MMRVPSIFGDSTIPGAGRGIFALTDIPENTIISQSIPDLEALVTAHRVDDGIGLQPDDKTTFNHSSDPNAVTDFKGLVVAKRLILAGEEITYDHHPHLSKSNRPVGEHRQTHNSESVRLAAAKIRAQHEQSVAEQSYLSPASPNHRLGDS